MKKSLLWIVVLLLSIAMVAVFSLAGCKAKAATEETIATEEAAEEEVAKEVVEEEEPLEPVTITMWYWGEQEGPGLEGWVKESAEMFQAENPNITVEPVLQTTEGLYAAFRTAAEAKDIPDIQYLWPDLWTFEDVWMGNVMDITEYWTEEDLQYITHKNGGIFEGKRYSIPQYFMPMIMVYNKTVLEDNGIESPPETWDEFIEDCITLEENGYVPFTAGLKDERWPVYAFDLIIVDYINNISDIVAPTIGKAKWTDYTYADWWKKLDMLLPYLNEDAASIDFYQGADAFGLGDAGFSFFAYGGIGPLYEVLGDDLVEMPFPKMGEVSDLSGAIIGSAQNLVVTAYCKHPKEANDFLKFITSPERANAMYVASGLFPTNSEFDVSLLRNNFEKSVFKRVQERSLETEPVNFIPNEIIMGPMCTSLLPMYNGEITPEEAAQKVENEAVRWRESNPEILENFIRWYDSMVEMGR